MVTPWDVVEDRPELTRLMIVRIAAGYTELHIQLTAIGYGIEDLEAFKEEHAAEITFETLRAKR